MQIASVSDSVQITTRTRTPEGFLRARGRLTNTAVAEYNPAELGVEDPGRPVRLYRRPESVFDSLVYDALRGMPITIEHPPDGEVNPSNWRKVSIGSIVGNPVRTDNNELEMDLLICDADAIAELEFGRREELSLGYRVAYESVGAGLSHDYVTTGLIAPNHLALTKRGRGGDNIRVLDSDADSSADTSDVADAVTDTSATEASSEVATEATDTATIEQSNATDTGNTDIVESDLPTAEVASDSESVVQSPTGTGESDSTDTKGDSVMDMDAGTLVPIVRATIAEMRLAEQAQAQAAEPRQAPSMDDFTSSFERVLSEKLTAAVPDFSGPTAELAKVITDAVTPIAETMKTLTEERAAQKESDDRATAEAAARVSADALIADTKAKERLRAALLTDAMPLIPESRREAMQNAETKDILVAAVGDSVPNASEMSEDFLRGMLVVLKREHAKSPYNQQQMVTDALPNQENAAYETYVKHLSDAWKPTQS